MKWLILIVAILAVALGAASSTNATIYYEVTPLGFVPQRGPGARINLHGQVIGNDSQSNGLLWENGLLTYLPVFPGTTGNVPSGINDAGHIIGRSTGSPQIALFWEDGTVTEFMPGFNATPFDINNGGLIVGHWYNTDGIQEAFLWDNGTTLGLGTFGGVSSFAEAVNSQGVIVGQFRDSATDDFGFVWNNGTISILDSLSPNDINDAGWVVGQSRIANQAFVRSSGETTILGALKPNHSSVAWAINNSGLIVGESYGFGHKDAILWQNGNLLNLNEMLLDKSWHIELASDINDVGQIVGLGMNADGWRTCVLLTPTDTSGVIPEPTSIAIWSLIAVVGFVATSRRSRHRSI